jgi:ATP-dependent RNA helicase DDX27
MAKDLIKTINDDDDVPDLSENSESDDDAQPKKNRVARRTKKDFETGFSFAASQKEYMTDTWNDVSKYIKKQAKSNLDEKIAQVRQERGAKTAASNKSTLLTVKDSDDESDESLSDDEMIGDEIKVGVAISGFTNLFPNYVLVAINPQCAAFIMVESSFFAFFSLPILKGTVA